jgi:hypothetical protein
MIRQKFFMLLCLFGFSVILTSCSEDESDTSVENYTNSSIENLNASCRGGEAGCYELVFPITIQFSDSTTVTVDGYEALREAIITWKKNNSGERPKPQFVFPISVINEAGEVLVVNNQEELRTLVSLCRGTFGGGGRPGHGGGRPGHGGHGTEPCFTINFPVTIMFPDSSTVSVASKTELKAVAKAWKEANPDVKGKPKLVFPISVTLEDGTVVTINSEEELKALKKDCRG